MAVSVFLRWHTNGALTVIGALFCKRLVGRLLRAGFNRSCNGGEAMEVRGQWVFCIGWYLRVLISSLGRF